MQHARHGDRRARWRSGGRVLRTAVAAASLSAGALQGQTRHDPTPLRATGETVSTIASPDYEAGDLRRALVGAGWRSVWGTPVDAFVFDFDRFAGGVEWTDRGGRSQSRNLHFAAVDGWREYNFRSVDKHPEQGLPAALRGTLAGRVVEDLIGTYFPAAPLLVPPLLEAVGVLHVEPELRVMPDDPRLGIHRDTFAGMLATVELMPNEAPDDQPGFAGSSKIKGSEEFFEDLDESKGHRLDERELLAARLVDLLINDTDRTTTNMRWARFGEEGDYRWRPIPVDRDRAFVHADGWAVGLVSGIYPKYADFGPRYPLRALTYGSYLLDRRLLQRLTRDDFVEVAACVRAAITDDVIEAAMARMPEAWRRETDSAERIASVLRARRDGLVDVAEDLYALLATWVDLHGTDEGEQVTLERHDDGRLRVTMRWPGGTDRAGEVHYDRTFLPAETREVRVHLGGGDDTVRVVGAASDAIVARVVGGEGDDLLADSAGGGATHLYAAEGEDRVVAGAHTRVSTRSWTPPQPREGWRLSSAWVPDWGGGQGWAPKLEHEERTGVVVGVGPRWTTYGFRRLPHHRQVRTALLYAPPDGLGVELEADHRFEASPLALTLLARGTTFEPFRFNGYGNDAPALGDRAVVEQDRLELRAALVWHLGWRARESDATRTVAQEADEAAASGLRPLVGRIEVGPRLVWSDAEPAPGSPLAGSPSPASGSLTRPGLRVALELDRTDRDALPRRGWRLEAETAGWAGGDLAGRFTETSAEARGYVPLPGGATHLAVRAGGSRVSGAFPVQHSSSIGGQETLRGHRWQRFRGDAAAWGSAEARVPVAPLELLVRWNVGAFAFADAGRVWLDGNSPGGWHRGYGGGIWLEALGRGASLAYARGEGDRLHLKLGLPF